MALKSERVSLEIVEKIMRPLRFTQIVSNLVISIGFLFLILWKFGDISKVIKNYFKPDYFDFHFFSYVISLFRSSYFISIPIILILLSTFSYLFFSILKPSHRGYAENGY
jgi:hypothetical protein